MDVARRVQSRGVSLAAYEQGDPARPTILLVHGYPDSHTVWDGVAGVLAEDFHVVRYDTRGAGATGAPGRGTAGYRVEELGADLLAVADAFSPRRPVHVVGHDWGSVQAWEAVTDPAALPRIASFTSMSGPCIDHIGHWNRARLKRPTGRGVAQLLGQAARSWYIAAFQVPAVPEALLRRIPPKHWSTDDAVNGLNLYRANMPRLLARPRERRTAVPVHIVVLTRDRYIGPELTRAADHWVSDLRRTELDSGHWSALVKRPAEVAALIASFVRDNEGEPPRGV